MTSIEFDNEFVPQNIIDIPELGNFALEGINEKDGLYYYLLVKTSLGTSSIFTFGPIIPDVDLLPENYSFNYQRIPFKDTKMKMFVSKWLNDFKRKISIANIISEEDFISNIKDLKLYINTYSDEVY